MSPARFRHTVWFDEVRDQADGAASSGRPGTVIVADNVHPAFAPVLKLGTSSKVGTGG